ncbi:hypothetical protein [Wolbachia endosymbiont of Ctenocephalides felis wCfeT]|uniref:hypothetical protein n=1 Tax=Wolbachia endosymbiont of Ctenocephalides felis wCfeT TaxID=2732593 RepID=UPI0014459097|nr:hypothetical protein [Wolbachia endosymbiont of Ctenocephalides felis wCfeT]
MFAGIEFVGFAVSLAILLVCAFNPVLPTWALVALGANSLVCFVGGLAFIDKHNKESGDIKKAKEAVGNPPPDPSTSNAPNCGSSASTQPSSNTFIQDPPPPYSTFDPNPGVPPAPGWRALSDDSSSQHSYAGATAPTAHQVSCSNVTECGAGMALLHS